MPAYDYDCKACKTVFEITQSFSEEKLTRCPLCGVKGKIERLIGNGAFVFIKNDPTNIMSLAERNTKRLGKDYVQEQSEKKKEKKERGYKMLEEKTGASVVRPTDKIPWWRDGSIPGTTRNETGIDLSRISNVKRYVETGEK